VLQYYNITILLVIISVCNDIIFQYALCEHEICDITILLVIISVCNDIIFQYALCEHEICDHEKERYNFDYHS